MTRTAELRRVAEAAIRAAKQDQEDLPIALDAYNRKLTPSTCLCILDLLDEMAVSLREHTGLFVHGPEFERRVKALAQYNEWNKETT